MDAIVHQIWLKWCSTPLHVLWTCTNCSLHR